MKHSTGAKSKLNFYPRILLRLQATNVIVTLSTALRGFHQQISASECSVRMVNDRFWASRRTDLDPALPLAEEVEGPEVSNSSAVGAMKQAKIWQPLRL